MELTEQSHSALVEFDAYDGFRSVPDAMEYLMAATVFSQPPPNLEEPMRHIVYFDPEFDTQISWGAGQSTISRTAPIYPAAGTIFRLPASEVDHTVSRVKECHQSIAVRVPCGGARQAAFDRDD